MHVVCRVGCTIAVLVAAGIGSASADPSVNTVRILTSFPPTLFEPFRREFMKRNPQLSVDVIQRKTTAALSSTATSRPSSADIFWASAPDAFELLKSAGRLASTHLRSTGAPNYIAGYPVNDPDHTYLGFALSGYGLAYNPRYLTERGLPIPKAWEDLAAPVYAGHAGISSPSRSGTTHLVVEALLQSRGWDRGWALWSAIGGNLATVTARSFGVSAGVARGRFGVGVSIDFLARAPGLGSDPVEFILPREVVFAPASIAILADAPNRKGADLFIDFVLSPEGQMLLLRPDIGRLPVSPTARNAQNGLSQDLLGNDGLSVRSSFDAGLSARRYNVVNIIFDEMITHRRAALVQLWRKLHVAEQVLRVAPNATMSLIAKGVREALERPPITEAEASEPELLKSVSRVGRGLSVSEIQARFESQIRLTLEHNHKAAAAALSKLEGYVNSNDPKADSIGDRP